VNLECLFNPKSIAILGASRSPDSVGQGILRNLTTGCVHECEYCKPFPGKIFPVNPFADEILGVKCYPNLKAIPEEVDLAIICIPAKIVLKAVKDCIKKGVKAVIIVSSGFAETGKKGKQLQDQIVRLTKKAKIALVGPNCLGIIRPQSSMNASFAPSMPPAGAIGFVSQSGALADSIIDWAIEKRYGFSAVVSYGNKAVLDAEDFVEWLGKDPETKAIAVYIEGLTNGRKFMEITKKVSRTKPIVVLKAGKTAEGEKAVSSHTASLAGSSKLYSAAFKQCGLIEAETVEELFDIAKVLAEQPLCKKNSIGIVTNGGGCGVLCADHCENLGVRLAELSKTAIKRLDASGKMHPAYSRRNPLDVVGDAMPERYEAAINILLQEKNIYGLIVIQTLQAMTKPVENAMAICEAKLRFPDKPVICVYMGGRFSKKGMQHLEFCNVPDYNDIRKAVLAMKALIKRGELLDKRHY
jgi:acetyltransferase